MILIDTGVIIHAAGTDHLAKAPSAAMLRSVASGDVEATTDAHILGEILQHYRSLGRPDDAKRVYDLVRQIFPHVLPVTATVMDRARRILDADPRLHARNAIHAAIVMTEGMEAVCSYDRGFDRIMGIVRREPR